MTGRNKSCWCGSGRKYKHCHLRREEEEPLSQQRIEAMLIRNRRRSQCMHPEAGSTSCGRAVRAHTIPRASTLGEITDQTNHVLSFYPGLLTAPLYEGPWRVGWRRAATFAGFCSNHDNATFALVEDRAFGATGEQCFLLAYRAVCYELWMKRWLDDAVPGLRDVLDRGKPREEQRDIQQCLTWFHTGVRRGLVDIAYWKEHMDRALMSQDYAQWAHCVFTLGGHLCVAGTGVMTPELDYHGNEIQTLENLGDRVFPLALSMIVSEGKEVHIIMSWPAETGVELSHTR